MWNTISTYNIFPNELLDLLGRDRGQQLGLYPFGEIVNGYNQEFHLPFVRGEGAEDIHSPFSKAPWG